MLPRHLTCSKPEVNKHLFCKVHTPNIKVSVKLPLRYIDRFYTNMRYIKAHTAINWCPVERAILLLSEQSNIETTNIGKHILMLSFNITRWTIIEPWNTLLQLLTSLSILSRKLPVQWLRHNSVHFIFSLNYATTILNIAMRRYSCNILSRVLRQVWFCQSLMTSCLRLTYWSHGKWYLQNLYSLTP